MKYATSESKPKKVLTAIVFFLLIGVLVYSWYTGRAATNAISGIRDPIQTETTEKGTQFSKAGYNVQITYKYAYDIEGLVVHAHGYHGLGLGDRLAPLDLALAWGKVAEYNDRVDLNWSQANRYVLWEVDDLSKLAPMDFEDGVNRSCSNNHLIPATQNIRFKLMTINPGDHVRIKGYLADVYATKPNGAYFTWNSSVTREDKGGGACELIYVTSIEKIKDEE